MGLTWFMLMVMIMAAVMPWRLAVVFVIVDWVLGSVIYELGIKERFEILRCVPREEVKPAEEERPRKKAA